MRYFSWLRPRWNISENPQNGRTMDDLKPHSQSGTEAVWYSGWDISDAERARYSVLSKNSFKAKRKALSENRIGHYQEINKPRLDPNRLMPKLSDNGLRSLSLFSGGGGLDLGFDRAGYQHVASYELLPFAGETLRLNRPDWKVFSGSDGDVTSVDWTPYHGKVDVVHGGPPCQPFSTAGRQRGSADPRDMIPQFVRCVNVVQPQAFVAENVPGLTSAKFKTYLEETLFGPLRDQYHIQMFVLNAASFGVPQVRRRVIFVGFKDEAASKRFKRPEEVFDHAHLARRKVADSVPSLFPETDRPKCMGVRQALGLPESGYDTIAPTLRCTLTGPRNTTSILSSTSAQYVWGKLGIWPNGVQESRELASAFETKDGGHRLSVEDCALLQGFPEDWKFHGPVYQALGQIGNSVAPPMGYHIALSVAQALLRA